MSNSFFKHIHHVAIICSDYERSKHFYTQIMGFSIIHEAYRIERQSYKLDLKVDENSQIELFSFPSPPSRPSKPEACGLRHLAFAVVDINEVIQHLAQHDVICEPVRVDEFTNKRFTFFQDPDGLPLEIYENLA